MLEIKDYKKSYGKRLVLNIPRYRLEAGIYWIQGVNGSGKSTLLKTIAGIISFGGIITCNGLDIRKNMVDYRAIVNISDAEPLFPEFLTGWELIRMFEEAKKGSSGQAKEMAEELQMINYLDSMVATYSSGMLKKLALLLAFIGTPKLVLLDEPFITIDTATLEIVYSWIKRYHQCNAVSFLLSSHQPIEDGLLPGLKKLQIYDKTIHPCL